MQSFTIIVAFQVLVALPFVNDQAAILLGFPKGGETSVDDYIAYSKFFGSGSDRYGMGAYYDQTNHWRFLSQYAYQSGFLWKFCYGSMVSLNVYIFFF